MNLDRVTAEDPIAAVESSREFVSELVSKCLSAVEANIGTLPLVFGTLIGSAKKKATEAFDILDGSSIVESVFFFLRFIGPCLLTPFAYRVPLRIAESELDGRARKGLVYVAKGTIFSTKRIAST